MQGRSMYIWHVKKSLAGGSIKDLIKKAIDHKISSLWIKIGDGETAFENINKTNAKNFKSLVDAAAAENINILGYHVPHCGDPQAAHDEAQFVLRVVDQFGLRGVVVDNEDGPSYFKGGVAEADAYGRLLSESFNARNRTLVMSSNDIVSAHPNAYAKTIGQYAALNAPQVYYGQSFTVRDRLNKADRENASIKAPFFPVGAAFVSDPAAGEGGCRNAKDCASRARDFINLLAAKHQTDPGRYPGYGFWNWEECPDEAWSVLAELDVFPHGPSADVRFAAETILSAQTAGGDSQFIENLIGISSDADRLVAAQHVAAKRLLDYDGEIYPHDGCAITLSVLLQNAGIQIEDTYTAIELGRKLRNDRGWQVVLVGKQKPGDVGSTCGPKPQHGQDHIYVVLKVLNDDEMVIADNQALAPHFRYASGAGGKTPTRFFLRAT
jgi:hypothetical protein